MMVHFQSFIKYFILATTILFYTKTSAQIPGARKVDWSTAGLVSEISSIQIVNSASYAFDNTGLIPADSVLDSIINNAIPPLEIHFSVGTFLFKKPIAMRSGIIISGEGINTKFIADLNTLEDFIKMEGKLDTAKIYITSDATLGTATITTSQPLQVDAHYLLSFNDSNLMFSSWAYGSAGQIYKVKALSATNPNQSICDSKHRLDYTMTKGAFVRKINPIINAAVRCLHIEMKTNSINQLRNINLKYAINCEVKGVQSFNCNFAHLAMETSKNILVSGCYFHHAFDYGGGGNAYGVVCHFAACDNLIENNIFEHLRHAMLVQAGANGNVFAYNHSADPYWENIVTNSTGDIAIHGNYPYCNLFEGNVVSHIWSDNSHGANGKFNTVFRNRMYGYGFSITSGDSMNVIDNEMIAYTPFYGNYNLGASIGHFLQGNNILNATSTAFIVTPAGAIDTTKSYYLITKPKYLWSANNWPLMGLPNAPSLSTPSATNRYVDSNYVQCNEIGLHTAYENATQFSIYPNPNNGAFTMHDGILNTEYLIIDLFGRHLRKFTCTSKQQCINVNLPSATYLLVGNGKVEKFIVW
jgi:hypothetical protein